MSEKSLNNLYLCSAFSDYLGGKSLKTQANEMSKKEKRGMQGSRKIRYLVKNDWSSNQFKW